MATLPPIKRFVADDFQGVTTIQGFIGKFFYPLNLFLNAVYSALTNGLTLNANTLGQVNQATNVTVNSSGVGTTTVNWGYPQTQPVGVVVMNCVQVRNSAGTSVSIPATYPLISWSYGSGVVTITMQFTVVTAGALVAAGAGSYNLQFYLSGG